MSITCEIEGDEMLNSNIRMLSVVITILFSLSLVPVGSNPVSARSAQSYKPVTERNEPLSAESVSGDYVLDEVDGSVICRDATSNESEVLDARDETILLQVISPLRSSELSPADAGLQIILRGTPQLENFPQAKNAFLRAAETWENLIQTPITLIIDVDFGPTRFGQPYPSATVLGSTFPQLIGASALYPEVRSRESSVQALALLKQARQSGLHHHGGLLSIVRRLDGQLTVEAGVMRSEGIYCWVESFTLEHPEGERREVITPTVPGKFRGVQPSGVEILTADDLNK